MAADLAMRCTPDELWCDDVVRKKSGPNPLRFTVQLPTETKPFPKLACVLCLTQGSAGTP